MIVVGILGGGFEVKELKIPQVAGAARILSLIVGIALLGVGFKSRKRYHPNLKLPVSLLRRHSRLRPQLQLLRSDIRS